MLQRFSYVAPALLALAGLLAACGAPPEGSGEVRMRLTDAPADEAERLDVTFGEMHLVPQDAEGDETGITVVDTAGEVNVLAYRNGGLFDLGEATVPAGTYTQLRLIVSSASITLPDEDPQPVTVPSGAQTGLKIDLAPALTVEDDGQHEVRLDVDARRAIVRTGAGDFLLIPTALRALTDFGEVRGTVVADDGSTPIGGATVDVRLDGDMVTSTTTEPDDGSFAFAALRPGTYDLHVSATGYEATVVPDVTVTTGGVTDVAGVTLTPTAP